MSHRLRRIWHPAMWGPLALLLIVLGLAWQWGSRTMPYLLPPLQRVAETLVEDWDFYLTNAAITLYEALLGLAIGTVVAMVAAIAISESRILRRAILPLAVILNVTPLVAIAPALVVAFGFGPAPKLIVTALIVFFPVLINVAAGLRSVPVEVMQFYTVIRASRTEVLVHLRLPTALPNLLTALKIVFPLSIIGAVVAEMSAPGAADGLGTVISVASSSNRLAVVWAAIGVLAVMGSLLLLFVTVIERWVLRWHRATVAGDV
ncbi:ABC transporter permease [Naumannella halotolerans]|uniref:NitT/TauT family transport system permease protein n=1 Tax=Naumannella halotolerans TaxID=993414 RepID=A0A4R7J9X8_9ACTN|nr:ABC transporter permease [Naumannella halotolerans]TDT34155.1 NitT/TauT family transport system permease protein [Naumannella halotolerans]